MQLLNIFTKVYHPSQYFLYSLVVFIIGMALASWWEIDWRKFELFLFALMLAFLLSTVFWWRNAPFRLIGLLGLFLLLGMWRFSLSIPIIDSSRIEYYRGSTGELIGTIKKVDKRIDKQILTIEVEKISVANRAWDEDEAVNQGKTQGRVLVYAQRFPEFDRGDLVNFKGLIKKVEPIEDFRYDRFLAKDNIYSLVYYPQIFLIKKQKESFFTYVSDLKEIMANKFDQNLGLNESSVARAMILGDKSKVSQGLRGSYSQSGISHIMAISGMHISLLAIILMQVLIFMGLWRRQAFFVISTFLVLYLILIGCPASALRASLMAWLVLWAYHIQRLGESGNLLLLVAGITLFINPRLLRDDVGWQLSFLAVMGIIYIFPILEVFVNKYWTSDKWNIRSIVLITLSVQITTIPVIMNSFGILSLLSPISNLLVLPVLPFIMVSIISALAFSWLPSFLSLIFFIPAQLGLWYLNHIATFFSNLPVAYLKSENVSLLFLLFYYSVMFILFYWLRKRLSV